MTTEHAPEPVTDDPLQVTGRPKPAGPCAEFQAWRLQCSALGVVITACTVLELYPVSMVARVRIGALETFASYSALSSTREKAISKAAAWLEKMACTEPENA